jgi:zinc transporter 1/2/3
MAAQIKLHPLAIILLLLSFTVQAFSESESKAPEQCGSESVGGCHDKAAALKLKIIAIFSILVTSMIGVCLPLFSRSVPALQPDRDLFVLVKAFASGVILATGYMHVLPDSLDDLRSECLPETPWRKFPFTTFVAMLAAVLTLMVDSVALSYYKKRYAKAAAVGDGEKAKNGTIELGDVGHGHVMDTEKGTQLLRYRVIAQVRTQIEFFFSFSFFFHSLLLKVSILL